MKSKILIYIALNRFIKAQDGIYSKVLSEIKSKKKGVIGCGLFFLK